MRGRLLVVVGRVLEAGSGSSDGVVFANLMSFKSFSLCAQILNKNVNSRTPVLWECAGSCVKTVFSSARLSAHLSSLLLGWAESKRKASGNKALASAHPSGLLGNYSSYTPGILAQVSCSRAREIERSGEENKPNTTDLGFWRNSLWKQIFCSTRIVHCSVLKIIISKPEPIISDWST